MFLHGASEFSLSYTLHPLSVRFLAALSLLSIPIAVYSIAYVAHVSRGERSAFVAIGHSLAYTHAIERLAGVDVPARARALRVVLLELERVYNHVADIGALATDVALNVPASRAQTRRETVVRLQERLFGARLLRGSVALGGVTDDRRRRNATT